MQEKTLFETLSEIEEYFVGCFMNAMAGGKMQERYARYLDVLAEVKKLVETKEENA